MWNYVAVIITITGNVLDYKITPLFSCLFNLHHCTLEQSNIDKTSTLSAMVDKAI
jgi:hypothetical protein